MFILLNSVTIFGFSEEVLGVVFDNLNRESAILNNSNVAEQSWAYICTWITYLAFVFETKQCFSFFKV